MQAPPAQQDWSQAQPPPVPTQAQVPPSHSPQQVESPPVWQAAPLGLQQVGPASTEVSMAPPNSTTREAQTKSLQHSSWLEQTPLALPQVPQVPLTQLALLQSVSVLHGPP